MTAYIPKVKNERTLIICGQFLNTNQIPDQFTANINIEFQPDEIILKHVAFSDLDTANADPICLVRTDLIDNHFLFALPNVVDASDYCDTHFRNTKPINSTYTFKLTNFLGQVIKI